MKYKTDARLKNTPAESTFIICEQCEEPCCPDCFLVKEISCGQCCEAEMNGIKYAMIGLDMSISDAVISKDPYIKRIAKKIILGAASRINEEDS